MALVLLDVPEWDIASTLSFNLSIVPGKRKSCWPDGTHAARRSRIRRINREIPANLYSSAE
jgi:hypothetical protein